VVSGGSAIAWNPFSGGEHISPQRKKQRVIGNIHHLRIIALAPVFIALLVLALKTVFFFFRQWTRASKHRKNKNSTIFSSRE